MKTMIETFNTSVLAFVKDEDGVTILEYGLLVGLISIAAIGLFAGIGTKITAFFTTISNALTPPA